MTSQALPIVLASAILLVLLARSLWRVFRPRPSPMDQPLLFLALAGLSILVLRWPQISFATQFNPDESQMLAQGMRFLSHPVPWRDVDGTTSGPLNSLLLTLPLHFGAPATWQTARLVLWVSICLGLVFFYLTLRCFGSPAEVQFALMPTIFFYAFATFWDFLHYSSETLPVLLLAAGIYLLASDWKAARPGKLRLFFLGLIVGAIPFTKLQAAPLALFLFTVELLQLLVRHRRAEPWTNTWWREAGVLGLGIMLVPALIMGVVIAQGAFRDFWTSYVLASANYAGDPFSLKLGRTIGMFADRTDFRRYLLDALGALLLWLGMLFVRRTRQRADLFWPVLLIFAFGASTISCLVSAGKGFWHYQNLLIPTLAIFIGLLFIAAKAKLDSPQTTAPKPARLSRLLMLAFCALLVGIQLRKAALYADEFASHIVGRPPATPSEVSQLARAVSRPGDTLSVWGWMPAYYVETGLLPATRDAVGHYIISEGPYQAYFQKRYLADLEQSRPAIFIDAVAPGAFVWFWTGMERHEIFPELVNFIDANYTLWQSVPIIPHTPPVRIYLLKERAAELNSRRVAGGPGR